MDTIQQSNIIGNPTSFGATSCDGNSTTMFQHIKRISNMESKVFATS
jgi:hypothetical protein